MTPLDNFIRVCRRYLDLKDTEFIDVVFGCVFANRLDSKPVWIYFVGPPSSGRTEILQALRKSPEVVLRSTVTRPSLVSGYDHKKTGTDLSLIPQLNGKNLIIKDFTCMLNMRRETFEETLGLLRDAYDGRVTWAFGGRPTVEYISKFGVLAAVTNAIDQHRAQLAVLGERFLTYRLPEIGRYEKSKRAKKAITITSTAEQEEALANAAVKVLNQTPRIPSMGKQIVNQLAYIAEIACRARTEIIRDKWNDREPEIPSAEHPPRMAIQLANLSLGLAMARGRAKVGAAELQTVRRMAIHSITLKRLTLFKTMIQSQGGWCSISQVSEEMGFSTNAVSRWFQDLELLDLVEKRTIIKGGKNKKTRQFRLKDATIIQKTFEIS